MRGTYLKTLLLAAGLAGVATTAGAAISVTSSGAGPITFNSAPAAGDWSTLSVAGAPATLTDDAALEAAAKANSDATLITAALAADPANPIGTGGAARWMSNPLSLALGTRPTGNLYTLLMATLSNDTGGEVTMMTISYTLRTNTAAGSTIDEHVYGHQVYYSLSGTPGSWVRIPEFNVGNFAVPQNLNATLSLNWPMGTLMYVLWVDDNGPSSGTAPMFEGGYLLDDFAVSFPGQAPLITQQPAGGTFPERSVVTLSVAASGSPPLTYQWTKGGVPIAGATSSTLVVTNIDETDVVDGHGNAKYAWSNPMDSGTYRVIVTGSTAPPATSDPAVVTVTPDTTPPAFSYGLCGPLDGQMSAIMTEPLNNSGGAVDDNTNWEIKTVDESSSLGEPSGVSYTDDGNNTTIVFTLNPMFPRDPTQAYKIVLKPGVILEDAAKTPNTLTGPASINVLCFTNELLAMTANWQYNDDDVEPIDQLPTTWKDVGYVDTAGPWATGAGPFDSKRDGGGVAGDDCRNTTLYGLGAVGTCINQQSPVTMTNLITAYFRTHFTFSGSTAGAVIYLNGKFDDGAIVYLNGSEVWRTRMPAGAVGHNTFANVTCNDGDPQDEITLSNPPSLVSGDNVLAVELHEVNITSSDQTMGLRVSKLVSDPPITQPTLTITYNATLNEVTITSTAAGTLWSSTNIETPRASWTNEGAIGAGGPGRTLTATGARKFFFVSIP